MTRERERGTMENLLATPVRPLEVMIGKILPYVVRRLRAGGDRSSVAARLLFEVPMVGSFALLIGDDRSSSLANLARRLHVLDARAQPAAGDADDVLLLPAVDPAVGLHVPVSRHAAAGRSALGEALPLTHFLRIVRGVMLKGNDLAQMLPHLWPMLLFLALTGALALARSRRTLD